MLLRTLVMGSYVNARNFLCVYVYVVYVRMRGFVFTHFRSPHTRCLAICADRSSQLTLLHSTACAATFMVPRCNLQIR